jgi:cell division septum initiation protein DivIVA
MHTEEAPDDAVATALLDDEPFEAADGPVDLTEPIVVPESPVAASTRVLEVATLTADQLVADAHAEADSLVTSARAETDALRAASREEAERVAAELARLREEQSGDLARKRTTALSELADQKAGLEAKVEALRERESDYRNTLRRQLTEQLAQLDEPVTEPAVYVVS